MFLDHDIETALTDRIKALESKSRDYALQAESGKLLPAMLTVGSIAASIVNPTAPLFALIGAAGYAASLLLDHHNTGRFTPIPCKRSSVREIREELLSDEPIVKTLFDTTIDSLDPGDRQEYFVLTRGIDFLKTMLNSVPPEHREALYEQAWRNPRNYFPADMRVVEALEAAAPPALPPSSVTVNNDVDVTVSPAIINVSVEAPAQAPSPAPTIVNRGVYADHRNLARVAQESIARNQGRAENDSLAIIKRYAAMRQNLLVLSVGGGGKGILLSNLFRFRAESDPDFFAYWVDPKGDKSESGYFDHASIVPYRFDGMGCKKDELSSHIQTAMGTYSSIRSEMPARTPNWLCFDEWTSINHRLKNTNTLAEVHDYVASAVSLLDGQNSHLLLVGQSPKLSDIMAEGGGLLSNFSSIVLFKREDRSFKMFEKCQQCGTIPKSIGVEKLYAACDQSPVNRAVYIDGQLLPMPRLANYSSYDRDTGMDLNNDCDVCYGKN